MIHYVAQDLEHLAFWRPSKKTRCFIVLLFSIFHVSSRCYGMSCLGRPMWSVAMRRRSSWGRRHIAEQAGRLSRPARPQPHGAVMVAELKFHLRLLTVVLWESLHRHRFLRVGERGMLRINKTVTTVQSA